MVHTDSEEESLSALDDCTHHHSRHGFFKILKRNERPVIRASHFDEVTTEWRRTRWHYDRKKQVFTVASETKVQPKVTRWRECF